MIRRLNCCKIRFVKDYNAIVLEGEALTNFVPAVAVIRRGLVLFALTGCKGCVGGLLSFQANTKFRVQRPINTNRLEFIRRWLNIKCKGEIFRYLKDMHQAKAAIYFNTDTEAQKHRDQTGLETLVVYALTDEY